ncbi:MAG: hypothetical protein KA479_04025 [Saprospiraceae bacterium]|nr:hypothetical protein [Saprospiraceae bacterium]
MYKIPEDFNLNSIQNEEISQIAFGLNFITLFLSNGFIQFSGSFSFFYSSRKHIYDEVFPVQNDYGLLKLLEKKIVKATINNERDALTLDFEEGIILELIGSKEYESFTINLAGKKILV